MTLAVVAWKWRGPREFTSQHVNTLARAIRANLTVDHEFVCVTDDPRGLDRSIRPVPLPKFEHIKVRPGFPSCYVRLRAFDPDFARQLGPRFLTIDVDAVITGSLDHLVKRDEPIVLWENLGKPGRIHYQGGIVLMDAGARPEVWESFDPATSPAILDAAGYAGDDQAWMSHCLWPNEATWPPGLIVKARHIGNEIPRKARMVHFPGVLKPWHRECRLRTPRLARAWERYAR